MAKTLIKLFFYLSLVIFGATACQSPKANRFTKAALQTDSHHNEVEKMFKSMFNPTSITRPLKAADLNIGFKLYRAKSLISR